MRLTLRQLSGRYAVCRLPADAAAPAPAPGPLWAVVRRAGEVSIVCAESCTPRGARIERGWSALAVEGPLDFGLVGVLAGLTGCLADAGVPVFAISSFDTDVLLVQAADLERAVTTLSDAGHRILAR